MRKVLQLVMALFLVGTLLWGGALVLFVVSPNAGSGEAAIFEVKRNDTPRAISRRLLEEGLVADADHFHLVGKVLGQWGRLKAGDYRLSPAMTPLQIFEVITSGVSFGWPLVVREGDNRYEIASAIEQIRPGGGREFIDITADPLKVGSMLEGTAKTLEGYLFPDTYSIPKTMAVAEIATLMLKRFEAIWKPEWTERARTLGMTQHQVVVLASIIEKETGAPQERPRISSVFHNRLKKRMRLQSDPTTIYGIWHRYRGNIRRSDLLEPTPYNTYTVPALPVGPISNPGKESLQAALYPEETEYLFFVSRNDGTHEFTSTLQAHNEAVKRFQLNQAAREGKSWRDLKRNSPSPGAPSTSP